MIETRIDRPTAEVVERLTREAEHGKATPVPLDRNGLVLLQQGPGREPQILDLAEEHGDKPRRHRGSVQLTTVDALTAYLKVHADEGTTVWVHPTSGRVEAVIDDHTKDQPAFGEHRAVLQLDPTPAWKAWTAIDGSMLKQRDFAEFIEDNLLDIVVPDAATLLEVAQTLSGKTDVEWKSARRLQDGSVDVRFTETVDAQAGIAGDLPIPTAFVLKLAPFRGEEPTDVHGRLRWRLNGGQLTLGIRLDQPHLIVERVVGDIRDRLAGEFANVYVGTPRR